VPEGDGLRTPHHAVRSLQSCSEGMHDVVEAAQLRGLLSLIVGEAAAHPCVFSDVPPMSGCKMRRTCEVAGRFVSGKLTQRGLDK
jgi:hypothetical protein